MSFKLPAYTKTVYTFLPATGCFANNDAGSKKITYKALPPTLTRRQSTIKRNEIDMLAIPAADHQVPAQLFTGLGPTIWPGWFTGEHRRRSNGKKINTFLLIHFTTDQSTINVFSFPGCNFESNTLHQSFTAKAIPAIIREQFL